MPRPCLLLAVSLAAANLLAPAAVAADEFDGPPPADPATVLDPVLVPQPSDHADPATRQSVAQIMAARRQNRVSAAAESYVRVPGCEPLLGSLRGLPLSDRTHHVISRGLCLPGQWVDSWFAGPDDDFYAARTLVRLIASRQWQQDTPQYADLRIDARIILAHTEDRLSLILRSDDQQDDRLAQRDRTLRGHDDGDPGVFRAALRWAAVRSRRAVALLDFGLRGQDPFVRMRWRYGVRLPWALRLRLLQEFYWRDTPDRRGAVSEFQLERYLASRALLRMTTSAESNTRLRREDIDGIWSQSLSWIWQIQHRTALQLSLQLAGARTDDIQIRSRRLGLRLKHSLWRPWLYLELEPYLLAERESGFSKHAGATARIELQFGDYQ